MIIFVGRFFFVFDGFVKEGFVIEDILMVVVEVIEDVVGEDEIDGVEKVDNIEGVREDDMEEIVISEGEVEFVEVFVDDVLVLWEIVEGVE